MIWSQSVTQVSAPATSANLGPGFDAFGLALGLYDDVQARLIPAGLAIEVVGEGEQTARAGERHLVVQAMRAGFAALGGQPPGIALRCVNAIPHGRGLGSSAAAICSGLLAARALVSDGQARLSDDALFQLAAQMEGHPDNVAACLTGGLTITWAPRTAEQITAASPDSPAAPTATPATPARLLPVSVPASLCVVACVPAGRLSTAAARRALPPVVPHTDATANAARSALLIAALSGGTGGPADLLFQATEDFLQQPYRAGLMPATSDLLARLRGAGLAAVVSGAGPSVLVLSLSSDPPTHAVDSIARETGIAWRVIPLDIDRQGAHVQQGGLSEPRPASAVHSPSWNLVQRAGHSSSRWVSAGPASFFRETRTVVGGMLWALVVLS